MFNMPYMVPGYCGRPMSYKTLEKSLMLIRDAVQDEREDELFYDYLISVAPTQEEKEIIASIRDDERKHNKMFREIYKAFTGQKITTPKDIEFKKSKSYIDGIKKALFGELAAVERYRDIRAGMPNRYYRDMVFEILTDQLKHANKYNYILSINKAENSGFSKLNMSSSTKGKTSFTTEEASEIAKQLGIDFSKEKFDLEQFRMGLDTELEHGRKYFPTNVTEDDPIITGKIALAHLREFPDYYTRLTKLEEEAKAYWSTMTRHLFRINKDEYTPDQWVMYIEPLVQRALEEVKQGINLEHLFQEFILSGVLVGRGYTPQEAIEQVEIWENTGESKLLKESKMKK
ncbi:DUF5661 family protein [Clostridium ganghwense]|uniref:Rubrerythrin diiron-binding domain-containing protein n=1 Tax=Clostridium ganghwense TaxID=312089 RepID=A0ABT4CSJ2_9CLOT|nr:DUF5661 family protein [Clostridium ganghwense]MCY6372038.1 hypothetical protein [Clostridium ganghwense]